MCEVYRIVVLPLRAVPLPIQSRSLRRRFGMWCGGPTHRFVILNTIYTKCRAGAVVVLYWTGYVLCFRGVEEKTAYGDGVHSTENSYYVCMYWQVSVSLQ